MRPHVVILGSGASKAAIPTGDKYGRKTSTMSGFISELGMNDIIGSIDLETKSTNLEDVYSEIAGKNKYKARILDLEKTIYEHFSALTIPDAPTVYDYLILSLTKKDLIATFNWDPLLTQAYHRACSFTKNLPQLAFLHGNVAYGTCTEHGVAAVAGNGCRTGGVCKKCKDRFKPSKLLFPVANKNYHADALLKHNWKKTQRFIKKASMVTIYGYSAPKTDKSAIRLLQQAWGGKDERKNDGFTIIDILQEDVLLKTWGSLILSHHYKITKSFFDSYLGKFPRRSCEAFRDSRFNNTSLNDQKGFRPDLTFDEVKAYLQPLTKQEMVCGNRPLPNAYR